jgi:probable rRNA maturation factor
MNPIAVQIIDNSHPIPEQKDIEHWVNITLYAVKKFGEVVIRIVAENEIQFLNDQYRKKNKPTNVLSFPFQAPDNLPLDDMFLGDVIICSSIVAKESKAQQKPLQAHWAHMVIHGTLHLLGYDHIEEKDALIMEPIEIDLLHHLGFDNPYEVDNE